MSGKRKWLSSSLIFFIMALAFSTVLVYSIPAEKEPFMPELPAIPEPGQDNSSLYRSLMQNKPKDRPVEKQSAPQQVYEAPAESSDARPEGPAEPETTKPEKSQPVVSKPETFRPQKPGAEKSYQKRQADQKEFDRQRKEIATMLSDSKPEASSDDAKPEKVSKTNAKTDATDILHGIEPYKNRAYKYTAPSYYRGIYLTNYTARTPSRYTSLLKHAKAAGVNTLVVDAQPQIPDQKFVDLARSEGFYLVSRVVVFQGGLTTARPPEKHLKKVLDAAEGAAKAGFMEIQLDYIRFADRLHIRGMNLTMRYRAIASILQRAEQTLRPYGVRLGADIFGRIPFNHNDIIGQKMEVFAPYLDTLYPMLYPSHFYGDPFYQKNPYRTIYDGKTKAIKRAGTTRIIAYIQGFTMSVGVSGLSFKNYIKQQIKGAADSGGAGFIVWNPHNDYRVFFQALKETN